MAFSLILNQKHYSANQLRQAAASGQAAHAPSAKGVLEFVQGWLQGEQEFVVHTSGSTGEPKPIQVSRQRMQASAQLTLQALGITPGTPALLCINPRYIGGKMMLVRAMEGGLPLLVVEPTANPLRELSPNLLPKFAALVPLQLQAILQDPQSLAMLNTMSAVIVGGAAVSAALEEELQQVQAPLYSTYGMTETVSHVALRRLNGPEKEVYFKVLPGITIGTDARGCLTIEGPVVEKKVVTNDVVELVGADKFRWLGRVDNIINSGGVKVQAERVELVAEACLRQLGIFGRVLAGGVADEVLGSKVVLLLEGHSLSEIAKKQLLQCMKQQLPRYWAPKEILTLSKFIESENGKVKRKENWQKALE